MDKSGKFLLPSPKFLKLEKTPAATPHFLSPQGMLLPKEKQPPPMYGPRGSTIPPKYLDRQISPNISNPSDRPQKFYCDPCEAEFHTSTDFKVHRSEHVQCEIDNCSFRGHPSFMDTHIGLQHATGLYNDIKKLSTPEEIAQWRADRKKNYPTVAAVQQKQKAREQRMLRGEKLEEKKNRFGNREDRRQIRTEQQSEAGETGGRKNSRRNNRKRNRSGKPIDKDKDKKKEEATPAPVKSEEKVEPEVCGGLKMFTGTSGMAGYKKVKKVESHALMGLLGMYGSDSEDDEDEDENSENTDANKSEELTTDVSTTEKPFTQKNLEKEELADELTTSAVQEVEPGAESTIIAAEESDAVIKPCTGTNFEKDGEPLTTVTENGATEADVTEGPATSTADTMEQPTAQESDDEAPEEAPIAKSSNIPDKPETKAPPKKDKKPPPKKKPRPSGLDYRKLRTGRQNTLLEKLLESDIRHERNVLLQCVRFVVENNFFGIGSSTTQSKS